MHIGDYELIWWPPVRGQVTWTRTWETGVSASGRGNEEREAKRAVGLKAISYAAQPVSIEERQALLAALAASLKSGKGCAPFWGRSSVLAADCSGTTVTLEDNAWGFVITENIFLFDQDARAFEVRSIAGVVGNVLTLSGGAVARTYRAGTLVWPLIFGKVTCDQADIRTNHRAEPQITIAENETGLSKVEVAPALTSYLGRPVAPLDGESSRLLIERQQKFSYDLRELMIGFGAASYGPIANNIVNGFEVSAILDGVAAIQAWDGLTASLPGRAAGFWLADVSCVFDIVSAPAADKVRVTDSDLADVWADDPAVFVIFRKEGSADKFAKILSVTDVGGGLEEVVLDAAVSVDASWLAYRLRYVRLAADEEKGTFIVENQMAREIRVVELPEEYAAVETGRAPVWLYTFWIETPGGNTYWRYTSYADNLTSNGNVFAAQNLTHGAIKRSAEANAEEVQVDGDRQPGNVFALFAPLTLPLNLWLQIEEATLGDPDTTEILFTGIAQKSPMDGRKASIKFSSFLDALGADLPNFTLQPRCNHRLFGPGCRNLADVSPIDRANYEKTVDIAVISADRLVIDLHGHAGAISGNNLNGFDITSDNYWALGWLEIGAGATYQIATILKSISVGTTIGGATTPGVRVWLSMPLQAAAAVLDVGTLRPGCDGTIDACHLKFANYPLNYGGQPFIPTTNPALPELSSLTAAKK